MSDKILYLNTFKILNILISFNYHSGDQTVPLRQEEYPKKKLEAVFNTDSKLNLRKG